MGAVAVGQRAKVNPGRRQPGPFAAPPPYRAFFQFMRSFILRRAL